MSIGTQAIARWKSVPRWKLFDSLLNFLPWFMVITLIGTASLFTNDFFTAANLSNVMQHAAPLGIMVVGEAMCLMIGYFDLALESTLVLSAVTGAWLIADHPLASGLLLNPYIGMLAMLACGALLGLFQGILIVRVKANPMLTTLALSVLLRGIAMIWIKESGIFPMPAAFRVAAIGHIGPMPSSVLILLVVYLLFYVFLTHSPIGRSIYLIGGNSIAAKACGINVQGLQLGVFTFSGLMAALAGILLCGRMNTASLSLSSGRIFDVFAAGVIGGVSIQGGKGNALGVFGGVLLLVIIGNLLNIFNFPSHLVEMIRGIVLLTAALIDALRWRVKLSGNAR